MNELALAAFAAARDSHPVDRDARTNGFAVFADAFDADAYLDGLKHVGIRWLARSEREFPPLLASIHDPPPGLFLRGVASVELLSRRAIAIVGARSCTVTPWEHRGSTGAHSLPKRSLPRRRFPRPHRDHTSTAFRGVYGAGNPHR